MALQSSSDRLAFLLSFVAYLATISNAATVNYTFVLQKKNFTRLCENNTVVTVNGQLPGPTIRVHDGDTVIIKVYNKAGYNATIHWHGVEQLRTGWADGPAYVTQCPIAPGGRFTQNFTITGQEGTIWWHAHYSWLRASVHGAFIIYPKKGKSYPFPKPAAEVPIIIGEWWKSNPIAVIDEVIISGGAPNLSNSFTINGQPGDLLPCSDSDTIRFAVKQNETYLLRIVNAALNTGHFLKITDHEFTVVAVDGCYTKPYKTDVLVISSGQTTDVLLTANQTVGKYYMAARAYNDMDIGEFDNTTTTAILEYEGAGNSSHPTLPTLPAFNDTATVDTFSNALRSLASSEYPVDVPQEINESLIYTVGLGLRPCDTPNNCTGPGGTMLSASVNNISFITPAISLLQAYYFNISGVYTPDFPGKPPTTFNYTGTNISGGLWFPTPATKVRVLEYNSTVQLVLQATNIFVAENHPMHLHGYNFYVVGQGSGNFKPETDPLKFNLVDPPQRNTVMAPKSGWFAMRFRADNPGVWYLHCHVDDHFTWGLSMVFLVLNGHGPSQTLEDPPADMPAC